MGQKRVQERGKRAAKEGGVIMIIVRGCVRVWIRGGGGGEGGEGTTVDVNLWGKRGKIVRG